MAQTENNSITVSINSSDKLIWEGKAISLSSINSNGPFDILPLHANFITIVENNPIKINTGLNIEEYTFPNAIIYASKNRVLIYTL